MIDALLELRRELEELKRVVGNLIRTGTVEDADPQKGYRLNFGTDEDGQPVKSPWYPYPESGGPTKSWMPLGKGQVMTAINPAGDSRQGFLVRGGFCDQFPQPSQSLDENVFSFGDVRITVNKDSATLAVDEVKLVVSRDGVAMAKGKITHNKKNIGDTHTHGGVMAGSAQTGAPA
jgi:phage baseplate assembly protein gpV